MTLEKNPGEGVPKETPRRHTLDIVDAVARTVKPRAALSKALIDAGYFDASLTVQNAMAVEALFELTQEARLREAILDVLAESEVDKFRGYAALFAVRLHGGDAARCVEALYRIGTGPGTWAQESAQTCLKKLMMQHGTGPVLERAGEWIRDPKPEARRMLIEALRPLGVWTGHLLELRKDPSLLRGYLEVLLDDPSRYVQNAAANCLNDISKDHPDTVCAWARAWSKGKVTDARAYILKRGLRTLIKSGHAGGLRVLGFADPAELSMAWIGSIPRAISVRDHLPVEVEVTNPGKKTAKVIAHVRMTGPGAGKKPRVALYQVGESEIDAQGRTRIAKRIPFRDRNSVPKIAGVYSLVLLVNGQEVDSRQFTYTQSKEKK